MEIGQTNSISIDQRKFLMRLTKWKRMRPQVVPKILISSQQLETIFIHMTRNLSPKMRWEKQWIFFKIDLRSVIYQSIQWEEIMIATSMIKNICLSSQEYGHNGKWIAIIILKNSILEVAKSFLLSRLIHVFSCAKQLEEDLFLRKI